MRNKSPSKRTKWIFFGATIGVMFALWRITAADAHIANLLPGILIGAWYGGTLAAKSPHQRREFLAVTIGAIAFHEFFYRLQVQLWPVILLDDYNKGLARLLAWVLSGIFIFGLYSLYTSRQQRV